MPAHSPSRQTPPPLNWFASTAGQGLLAVENAAMARVLAGTPALPWCWISVPGAAAPEDPRKRGVLLRREGGRFGGDARCALPLPMANETFGAVLLQHALDDAFHAPADAPDPDFFLGECERILAPGGVLWLATLNPWSPYRARWARTGLHARVTGLWQARLRRAGFALDSVSLQWLGPRWRMDQGDVGVGMHDWLRAGVALSVSKRVRALVPPGRLRHLRLHGVGQPRVSTCGVARSAAESTPCVEAGAIDAVA
jgi:SAM-dependent methyltransferase